MHAVRFSGAALTLLATLSALPAAASAQEPAPAQTQQCTAEFEPAAVEAGSAAVQVTATLSEDVGPVTGVAPNDGSIKTAAPSDLPRTEMATAGGTPQPIRMAEGQNRWIVWLNTAETDPGSHEITLITGEGQCTATLTIEEGSAS